MNKRIYDEASHVSAEDGEVIVDGPDGVAVSLTPRAAAETSDRCSTPPSERMARRFGRDEQRGRPTRRRSS